jgi:hypothetical protein
MDRCEQLAAVDACLFIGITWRALDCRYAAFAQPKPLSEPDPEPQPGTQSDASAGGSFRAAAHHAGRHRHRLRHRRRQRSAQRLRERDLGAVGAGSDSAAAAAASDGRAHRSQWSGEVPLICSVHSRQAFENLRSFASTPLTY